MAANNPLISELAAVVGDMYVVHDPSDLIVFEFDASASVDTAQPTLVVLPNSADQVSQVVEIALRHGLPLIARGAGTGLSGGSIARSGGILLVLTRMTRILDVDVDNRVAIVEAGVVNLNLTNAVSKYDLYYAPDPSSQRVCTIGGNVAENSGGPHCLAYGVTTTHVLGMEVVLADGSIKWFGGKTRESSGYDLRGVTIGSEGTLAIVTKVAVRLLRRPESVKTLLAVFKEVDHASATVSDIIAAGIVPAAMELMDRLCIEASDSPVYVSYPKEAEAVLLIEVDGLKESVQEESTEIELICQKHNPLEIHTANNESDRELLWARRKGILGSLGRLAPNCYLVDGTVPRTKLVEVLAKIREISEAMGLSVANVLHAGDGNLHPCILFDEREPGQTQRALEVGGEILKLCVEVGGVLSGEHGVGLEKREYMTLMFTDDDLEAMAKLKLAFDTKDMFNPGKIFPTGEILSDLSQTDAVTKAGTGAYI